MKKSFPTVFLTIMMLCGLVSASCLHFGLALSVANVTGNGSGQTAVNGLWEFIPPEAIGIPCFAAGAVFIKGSLNLLTALNASNGKILWTFENSSYIGDPTFSNGVLYAAGDSGNVYAINASTGTIVWAHNGGGYPSLNYLTVAYGLVYVTNYEDSFRAVSNLLCLNASNGNVIWNDTTKGAISSPTVANGHIYVNCGLNTYVSPTSFDAANITTHAFNAATGDQIWSFTVPWRYRTFDSPAPPFISSNTVYVVSKTSNQTVYDISPDLANDTIFALDASSGDPKWSFTTKGALDIGLSAPIVQEERTFLDSSGILYVSYEGGWGTIYAINETTGRSLWNLTTQGTIKRSPVVSGNILCVEYWSGSFNGVIALDAYTGIQKWTYDLGIFVPGPTGTGAQGLSFAVGNGTVFISISNGTLLALNSLTGASLWNYQYGGYGTSLYVGQNIYILSTMVPNAPSSKNGLYALESNISTTPTSSPTPTSSVSAIASPTLTPSSSSQNTTLAKSPSPTPSPTVPEFPLLIIPLALIVGTTLFATKYRKRYSNASRSC